MIKKLTIAVVIVLTGWACNFFSAPTPEATPIPVAPESSEQLKENFFQAVEEATESKEAKFRITNEQITSFLTLEIAQTGQVPLTNPQVWFTPGKINLTGVMDMGGISATAYVVAVPRLEDGRVFVNIEQATMSSIPLPAEARQSLNDTVNEALAEIPLEIVATRIEVLQGEMIVAGKLFE